MLEEGGVRASGDPAASSYSNTCSSCRERHCWRTVSCALGAPVKTIVSTQLTHGWRVRLPSGQAVKLGASQARLHGRKLCPTRIRCYVWHFHEKSLIQSRQKYPYRVATRVFCQLPPYAFWISQHLFIRAQISSPPL